MIVEVTPTKKPKTKAINSVVSVFIFCSSMINRDMLSFKKYMQRMEEAAATVPAVGTSSATTKTPVPTKPINPATRTALETAARSNPVALNLFSKGNQKGAVDTLRKDPKFLAAMAQVTAANPAANAAALVNVALGGNP